MATGIVKVFTELRSTVLNGRADVDFKIITFTFDIDFSPPFCSIKQDFLYILSFPNRRKRARPQLLSNSQTNRNKLSLI